MSRHGDEICRFTAERKTFFFNKLQAKNGNEYLGVNALWGDGNRERLTLFPSQMIPFWNALKESVGELSGLQPADEAPKRVSVEEPISCPDCGAPKDETIARRSKDGTDWVLVCKRCLDETGQFVFVEMSSPMAPTEITHNHEEYRP